MISDLEQRLVQIKQETRTTEPKDETTSQTSNLDVTENVTAEINPEVLEESQESVTVMPLNDSSTDSEEDDSESHQRDERKKRKFW